MPSSRSWGIGEFRDLAALARWMQGAGLRVLQLLPLNEMAAGQSSPYSALSAMALDPIFIAVDDVPDFQALGGDGLDGAMRGLRDHARASRAVDYRAVRSLKDRALRAAFGRFVEQEWPRDTARAQSLRRFVADQAWWLDDYALFRSAHQATGGRSWRDWPDGDPRPAPPACSIGCGGSSASTSSSGSTCSGSPRRSGTPPARRPARTAWSSTATSRSASPTDSADVWANQDLFSFDGSVGAPPDAFSDEGQNWALPVYRWDALRETGYAWFAARARRAADLFDGFRVDHVVGSVPHVDVRPRRAARALHPRSARPIKSRRASPCCGRSAAAPP